MGKQAVKVLIVDDEPSMVEVLRMRLSRWNFRPLAAGSVREAARRIKDEDPAIVLCDVVLPDGSGLDVLSSMQGEKDWRPVVMMTAHGSIDTAVEAVKGGAMDFMTKPLDYGKLKSLLDQAVREIEQRGSLAKLRKTLEGKGSLGPLVGDSGAMREVYGVITLLAENEASALITGESGTGKELAARAIHELGTRAKGPFVALNAAAIPAGLLESELFGHEKGAFTGATAAHAGCFEQADGGTLFLDEIAEMPAGLQPKFLRALEDGRVRRLGGESEKGFDVRLLAATNRDPGEAVRKGLLREDLFYRLNVFTLVMPPLRERVEDIPLLAQHFVEIFNKKHGARVNGVRPDAAALLGAYPWPGNVRELRNVMERATILSGTGWIETLHLPAYVRNPRGGEQPLELPPGLTMAEAEYLLVLKALEEAGNNKAEAARRLGVDVKTIRNKLKGRGGGG